MTRTALAAALATLIIFPAFGQEETQTSLSGTALIDAELKAKWKDEELKPAKKASDQEFLRRVTLDLVGSVPTLDDAVAFYKDKARDKRAKYIDKLLKSDRYVKHWTETWSGILVGFNADRRVLNFGNMLEAGLKDLIADNTPYNEFVYKLITATGKVNPYEEDEEVKAKDNPLVMWYIPYFNDRERAFNMAGKLARTFMSTQIQCAQCHDHPFDTWTQEDMYGMAAFFTQTFPIRRITNRKEVLEARKAKKQVRQKYEYIVMDRSTRGRGRMGNRRRQNGNEKLEKAKPAFIGVEHDRIGTRDNRRTEFAKILTSEENTLFAKSFVNRMWFYFFGRGIVDPFDDFTAKNRPSIPSLLDKLTQDFVDHDYDMKWLMKSIVMTEGYQLTSNVKERDGYLEKYFAYAQVRPLTPEQLLNSIFDAAALDKMKPGRGRGNRNLTRGQLRNRIQQQFRFNFGDDEGNEAAAFEGTIPQALLMMNSDLLTAASSAIPGTTLDTILNRYKKPQDRLNAIFIAYIGRPPTAAEGKRWVKHVGRSRSNSAYEDVAWVLLNSGEFLFNH